MAEVRKVEIAGKSYPFYFGMNAIGIYDEVSGGNFFQDMSTIDLSGNTVGVNANLVVSIAYAGIKDGYRILMKPFSLTKEEVADLFDEDINAIQGLFLALMEFGIFKSATKEAVNSANLKKKQVNK